MKEVTVNVATMERCYSLVARGGVVKIPLLLILNKQRKKLMRSRGSDLRRMESRELLVFARISYRFWKYQDSYWAAIILRDRNDITDSEKALALVAQAKAFCGLGFNHPKNREETIAWYEKALSLSINHEKIRVIVLRAYAEYLITNEELKKAQNLIDESEGIAKTHAFRAELKKIGKIKRRIEKKKK